MSSVYLHNAARICLQKNLQNSWSPLPTITRNAVNGDAGSPTILATRFWRKSWMLPLLIRMVMSWFCIFLLSIEFRFTVANHGMKTYLRIVVIARVRIWCSDSDEREGHGSAWSGAGTVLVIRSVFSSWWTKRRNDSCTYDREKSFRHKYNIDLCCIVLVTR